MSKLNRENVMEKMVGSLRQDVANLMTANAEYKAIIELQNEEMDRMRKEIQERDEEIMSWRRKEASEGKADDSAPELETVN